MYAGFYMKQDFFEVKAVLSSSSNVRYLDFPRGGPTQKMNATFFNDQSKEVYLKNVKQDLVHKNIQIQKGFVSSF